VKVADWPSTVEVGLGEVSFFLKHAHASKVLDFDGGATAQIQKDGMARGVYVGAGVDCYQAIPSVGGKGQYSPVPLLGA
jgi:hypothetical protein